MRRKKRSTATVPSAVIGRRFLWNDMAYGGAARHGDDILSCIRVVGAEIVPGLWKTYREKNRESTSNGLVLNEDGSYGYIRFVDDESTLESAHSGEDYYPVWIDENNNEIEDAPPETPGS